MNPVKIEHSFCNLPGFGQKGIENHMIYLFLADGFEEVEALTPLDYLRRVDGHNINTVGVYDTEVTGSHGVPLQTDLQMDEISFDDIEMIILPGGMPGTKNLDKSDKLHDVIDYCADNDIKIAAICAAPSILGKKGLLDGRKACCYPGFERELKGARISRDAVEVDDNFITARGAGCAQQFAFTLVEELYGKDAAQKLMQQVVWME